MPRTSLAAPSPFAMLAAAAIVLAGILAGSMIQGCSSDSPFRVLSPSRQPEEMRGL